MPTKKKIEPVEAAVAEPVVTADIVEPLPGQPLPEPPTKSEIDKDEEDFLLSVAEDERDYLDYLLSIERDEYRKVAHPPSPFDYGYENLCDVFTYGDILACTWNEEDSTVSLVVRSRTTGETFTYKGDGIDDVVYQAMDKLAGDHFLVADICTEYNLSVDELRALVAPPLKPIFDPVVVGAAQPLIYVDRDDKIYIGAYLPTPVDEIE